ncbi:hypothetical protein EDB87DRAFT_1651499 [Lactarius vividus]|nr:hypothetical protein EDB87DRAFT_1651499 [Lactarius vividus]
MVSKACKRNAPRGSITSNQPHFRRIGRCAFQQLRILGPWRGHTLTLIAPHHRVPPLTQTPHSGRKLPIWFAIKTGGRLKYIRRATSTAVPILHGPRLHGLLCPATPNQRPPPKTTLPCHSPFSAPHFASSLPSILIHYSSPPGTEQRKCANSYRTRAPSRSRNLDRRLVCYTNSTEFCKCLTRTYMLPLPGLFTPVSLR